MSPVAQVKLRYTWEEMRTQFREIARLFTEIEDRVQKEGKVNAHELDLLASTHKLSDLGQGLLADLVRQSDRVVVSEEGEEIFLLPNPDFSPDNGDLLEEEDTGIRELFPAPEMTTEKKIEYKGKA